MPDRVPAATTMEGVLRAKRRDIEAGRPVPAQLIIVGAEQPIIVPLPRLVDSKAREAFLNEQGRLYAGAKPKAVMIVGVEANSNPGLFGNEHYLGVSFMDAGGYQRMVSLPYSVADDVVTWGREDVTTNADLTKERNELSAFFRGVKEAHESGRAARNRRVPAWRFRR